MSLRIAFDLDGVLADMDSELIRQAELLFCQTAVDQPTADSTGATAENTADLSTPPMKPKLTPRQQRRLWRHVESIDNFWQSLHEIEPGVISRLAALAAERRWEIIFLTKRPSSAGTTAQVQTQRWLESNGYPLPSVFVVQGSRGRIAAALDLDFVVDDRPENCLDIVVDSKARAFLVWRADEKQLPDAVKRLGITIARSVHECLDTLARIDPVPTESPRMRDRVRRLLGLKATAIA